MNDLDIIEKGIEILVNSDINKLQLDFPNIPAPTLGGEFMWTTLAECNDWRLQQNMLTKHCRILDSDDVRIAWGTYEGMLEALRRLVNTQNKI